MTKNEIVGDRIEISRAHYDELCHHIRHLTTKAEKVSKRIAKIESLHDDLVSELSVNKETLFDRIKKLECLLNEIEICEAKDDGQKGNSN